MLLTTFWMIVSQAITIADAFYIAKLYCRNNTVVQTDLDVLNFLNSHLKLPKAMQVYPILPIVKLSGN